ncbi:hypothetical protein GTP56_03035 [Duganella sp. FT134W]|uniref:Uncharacterized protein n=1 Tax=Duganella margarita TaxID=2692170 RepID=A0A7X4KFA9_9BURK|nr:hypothetical protein [Duganella margarita]MYM71170.1 hypothetical protein [Duganella margarita]
MKISNNTSRQGIRWRWHCLRLIGLALMLAAFWYKDRSVDLIATSIVVFVGALASKALGEDLLVEVFDDGDRLRFELDEVHVSISLTDVKEVVFKDGGDGKDTVTILICHDTPFGRQVELVPEPNLKFQGNPKHWFNDLQKRVFEAKANVAAAVNGESVDASYKSILAAGDQNQM